MGCTESKSNPKDPRKVVSADKANRNDGHLAKD